MLNLSADITNLGVEKTYVKQVYKLQKKFAIEFLKSGQPILEFVNKNADNFAKNMVNLTKKIIKEAKKAK